MKIIIEFEDYDEATIAMQGKEWRFLAWDLDQYLRNQIKYSDKNEPELQSVRDKLHKLLENLKLNFE